MKISSGRAKCISLRRTLCIVLSLLFVGVAIPASQVHAETELVTLGNAYSNETCWQWAGNTARLERKYPTKPYWRTVARTRPVKSGSCKTGWKLVSFTWTPKVKGFHTLRQWVGGNPGAAPGISKPFKIEVQDPTDYPSYTYKPELPGSSSGSPTTSRGLSGCYFNGKKLWGSVYFTKLESLADVRIYYTNTSLTADLRVMPVSNAFSATSCGLWYVSNYETSTDLKVYVSSVSLFADLEVEVVNSSFLAGLK